MINFKQYLEESFKKEIESAVLGVHIPNSHSVTGVEPIGKSSARIRLMAVRSRGKGTNDKEITTVVRSVNGGKWEGVAR